MLNMSRTLAAAMLLAFAAGLGSTAIVSSASAGGVVEEKKPKIGKTSQSDRKIGATTKAGKSSIQMDGSARAIVIHGKNSKQNGNPAMNKQGSKQ